MVIGSNALYLLNAVKFAVSVFSSRLLADLQFFKLAATATEGTVTSLQWLSVASTYNVTVLHCYGTSVLQYLCSRFIQLLISLNHPRFTCI